MSIQPEMAARTGKTNKKKRNVNFSFFTAEQRTSLRFCEEKN
jgi:hypothetical protein